jgi:hypothetical protein
MALIATVTEYQSALVLVGGSSIQVAQEPPIAEQIVDFTSGATPVASAFNDATTLVRIKVNAPCSLQFAASPTPTTVMQAMGTSDIEYKGVAAGSRLKVGFISNTNFA